MVVSGPVNLDCPQYFVQHKISTILLRRLLVLTNKLEVTNVNGIAESNETKVATTELTQSGKKRFVEPEITVPVDILEATTFFQTASSGATN